MSENYIESGQIEVWKSAEQKLKVAVTSTNTCGILVGVWRHNAVQVFSVASLSHETHSRDKWAEAERAAQLFPAGLDIVGFYRVTDESKQNDISWTNQFNSLCKHSRIVCCNISCKDDIGENSFLILTDDCDDEPMNWPLIIKDEALHHKYILFRVPVTVPLILDVYEKDPISKSLKQAIREYTHENLGSEAVYIVQGSQQLLTCTDRTEETDSPQRRSSHETCGKMVQQIELMHANSDEGKGSRKKKKDKTSSYKTPVLVSLYKQMTRDKAEFTHSPFIQSTQNLIRCCHVTLHLNVIGLMHEDDPLSDLPEMLNTGIHRQLQSVSNSIHNYYTGKCVIRPEVLHFWPHDLAVPVTIVYPATLSDTELVSERQKLHDQLLLETDRPLFRRINHFSFSHKSHLSNGYLLNPHEGLGNSGMEGGFVSLVKGNYAYHHYLQNNMEDSGWGCAYRSLQTIISWFRLQGYTDVAIPTHAQIQQALVTIGDKPATFVGGHQWIGSFEVNLCLEQLLGVKSQIMSVNSGEELAARGRELAMHFTTQGTPVMIGGGVLAHTILGVHFNEHTGNIKFLILDPHYMGAEDLTTVLNKGWCGWKGPNFWDQTAMYNLCMPQRPKMI